VHVQIQITEVTNTAIETARFVTAAFDTLAAHLGELHPASYVVVEEIAADAWGYGGATQAARRLQLATAHYR
jgi:4-oxalocrotonate tautomerase